MFSRPTLLTVLITTTLITAACGKKSSTSQNNHVNSNRIYSAAVGSEIEASALLKKVILNSQISCPNKEDCIPGVAALAYSKHQDDRFSIFQCTSIFVGKNLILTNSHCVPEDLRKAGTSCKERMWVSLPEITGVQKEQHLGCDKVLFASDILDETYITSKPDYALVKLSEPVKEKNYLPSFKGIEANKNFTIYKINPVLPKSDSDSLVPHISGILLKSVCESVPHSIITPGSADIFSKIISFSDCSSEIVEGNSGSPILNQTNSLVGVIHGKLADPNILKNLTEIPIEEISNTGFGTNLACAKEIRNYFGVKSPIPSACSAPIDQNELSADERELILKNSALVDINEKISKEEKKLSLDPAFPAKTSWKLTYLDKKLLAPNADLLQLVDDKNYLIQAPECTNGKNNNNSNLNFYSFLIKINRKLQSEAVLTKVGLANLEIDSNSGIPTITNILLDEPNPNTLKKSFNPIEMENKISSCKLN